VVAVATSPEHRFSKDLQTVIRLLPGIGAGGHRDHPAVAVEAGGTIAMPITRTITVTATSTGHGVSLTPTR
jgi:orotidine-5'-phosphate decarboxylase